MRKFVTPKRRRLQFGLRGLLVAVTVLAVYLAAIRGFGGLAATVIALLVLGIVLATAETNRVAAMGWIIVALAVVLAFLEALRPVVY